MHYQSDNPLCLHVDNHQSDKSLHSDTFNTGKYYRKINIYSRLKIKEEIDANFGYEFSYESSTIQFKTQKSFKQYYSNKFGIALNDLKCYFEN